MDEKTELIFSLISNIKIKKKKKLSEKKISEVINSDLEETWKNISNKLKSFGKYTTKVKATINNISNYKNNDINNKYFECPQCKITYSNNGKYCNFCKKSLENVKNK